MGKISPFADFLNRIIINNTRQYKNPKKLKKKVKKHALKLKRYKIMIKTGNP